MVDGVKKWIMILMFLGLFVTTGSASTAEKHVIARLGDIEITVFELQRQTQRIMPFNKTFHGGVSKDKLQEVRELAFERLIEQSYMVHYARSHDIEVSSSQVDAKIEKVMAKFDSKKAFKKALRDESLKEFRSSVRRLLVAKKAEEIAVDSKALVGDEELLTFYRKNTFMYQRPKQYRASHILVKVDPSLVGEDREKLVIKAEELAERAKSGEDFYNLAYHNSDEDTKFVGGDVGYFHSGQTVNEFEEAVRDLKPGDIVGPVETISGFHVIKLTEVEEARQMTFDEVKTKIKKTIEDKKRNQLYNDWMTELKKQVKVDILHPALQKSE